MDTYLINDVNGNPISSKSHSPVYWDHTLGAMTSNPLFATPGANGQIYGIFQTSEDPSGSAGTSGYTCTSGCLTMQGGQLSCLVANTEDCELPIDCPEYLSDLVECVGTLGNIFYARLASGLLDVWKVIFIKYLINNLNPCITIEDLLSWATYLEEICPDCEPADKDIDEDDPGTINITNNSSFDF